MAENIVSNRSGFMDKIVALAKRRGFIYPGSELYGGLANTYDYGPVGVELLRNIKNLWWKKFVTTREDVVGIDANIISPKKVWDASGHTSGFSDVLIDCKACKSRMRADHLIEDWLEKNTPEVGNIKENQKISHDELKSAIELKKVEGWSEIKMDEFIKAFKISCPKCKKFDWTGVRKFNLLFPVKLGIVEGDQSLAYLRGETAQGIFINFRNIIDSNRVRLPFGVAQIGKSFRNEITLGNSVFRTIEFEQGELEYFFDPDISNWEQIFESWKESMWKFVVTDLGINSQYLRWRIHTDEERSFYSSKTEDLEYNFPFGFKELWGLGYRSDYDLKQHMLHSGKDLSITDPHSGKKIIPHVIEPAVGINRLFLMTLCDSYTELENRVFLKLDPKIAPYKVAVFPLLANKENLVSKAREIYDMLKQSYSALWDNRGNIGKRYLYQDEIGTPWCVTIDFQTLEDGTVTIRDRDTTKQERITISDLTLHLQEKLQ